MESTAELVEFPLLKPRTDYTYNPCTIPWRSPSDNPHKATSAEALWIELFRKSIPSFRKQAELDPTMTDALVKAAKFALRYGEILDDMLAHPESHGGPPDCIKTLFKTYGSTLYQMSILYTTSNKPDVWIRAYKLKRRRHRHQLEHHQDP